MTNSQDRLDRLEDKLEQKLDKIFDELSQISKTLVAQQVSIDHHIRRTDAIEELLEQYKEESEAETERLEKIIDTDEQRIAALECQKQTEIVSKTNLKSHLLVASKVIAIAMGVGGVLAASSGSDSLVMRLVQFIIGMW